MRDYTPIRWWCLSRHARVFLIKDHLTAQQVNKVKRKITRAPATMVPAREVPEPNLFYFQSTHGTIPVFVDETIPPGQIHAYDSKGKKTIININNL